MSDDFEPFYERHREPEPRVHTELTKRSRERIAHKMEVNDWAAKEALEPIVDLAGESGVPKEAVDVFRSDQSATFHLIQRELHYNIVKHSDSEIVLSYLEYLFIVMSGRGSNAPDSAWAEEYIDFLEDVLESEGLLWRITRSPENESGVIQFEPIESESMQEIDEKVQALAEDDLWKKPIAAYNDAFERYLNKEYDELIVKKLYNSIEETLRIICVDEEGWVDNRDLNHSEYLQILKDEGVYNANGITSPEMNDLLQGLERLVAKLGKDRKQRHNYIDRTYCTLLIHQVGAFLYFIINRYEDYSD